MIKDSLGDRMKGNYEDRYRIQLPRRTNVMIRVDGKAFHTFTKKCIKPFDGELMYTMDETAMALCRHIQGAKIAYVQSDEISVWVTDYDALETDAWFDNNLQKMVSVASSVATGEFNKVWASSRGSIISGSYPEPAHFDARAFIIPDITEVANYFLWRCQDATRNSVQMVARSLFSHKQCEGKSNDDLKMMITVAKGQGGWDGMGPEFKHGRIIRKCLADVNTGWVSFGVVKCEFDYWNQYVQAMSPKVD